MDNGLNTKASTCAENGLNNQMYHVYAQSQLCSDITAHVLHVLQCFTNGYHECIC